MSHFCLKQNTLSSPSIPFPPPCINNQLPANSYWKHHCESIHTVYIFHASAIVHEFQMHLPEEHLAQLTKCQGQEERAGSGSLLFPTQRALLLKDSVNTPEAHPAWFSGLQCQMKQTGTQDPFNRITEFRYNWVITAWQASVNHMSLDYLSDCVHKLLHSLWTKEDEIHLKSLCFLIRQLKDWPFPSF